jgi:hypothetical protein
MLVQMIVTRVLSRIKVAARGRVTDFASLGIVGVLLVTQIRYRFLDQVRSVRLPDRVGPNFAGCPRSIGRIRLPAGVVAAIDNSAMFQLALQELHHYAIANKSTNKARFGMVFRTVSDTERQNIIYKLQNLLGIENFTANSSTFHIPLGQLHVIDDCMIAHTWNRHANRAMEARQGQLPVSFDDLVKLPLVVHPRNIVNFIVEGGMPRIVYNRDDDEGTLVAVEEIGRKGIYAKTLYRKK